MKKNLFIIAVSFLLVGCINNNTSIDNSFSSNESSSLYEEDSSTKKEQEYDKPIIFSEIIVSKSVSNRAIEIANISHGEVDLSNYQIKIFRQYSETATHVIFLSGLLASQQTYVIVFNGADEDLLNKANLISDKLINDGSWAMGIYHKDDVLIDIVGTIGFINDYAVGKDIVRKKEYFIPRLKYEAYDYVAYPHNDYSHLGNFDVIEEKTLLEGPKLKEEDFIGSFIDVDNNCGTGKVITSKLIRTIDGDTSYFDYGNDYVSSGISGSRSTRYYSINTPEIAHNINEIADPYGNEARDFTNNKLNKAKSILLQSINKDSLLDNYGRVLMYVWISDKENPQINDYELLNFLIIKEGFSNVSFINDNDPIDEMLYMGVSYVSILRNAESYSHILGLNIHSYGNR